MPTPQATETVTLSIPMPVISNLRAELSALQTRCAEISGFLDGVSNYCEPGKITTLSSENAALTSDTLISVTAPAPRGRPRRDGTQPRQRTKNTSDGRPSAQDAAIEALATFRSTGAKFAQIRDWVTQKYGNIYIPNVLKVVLNRSWKSRKVGADQVIVPGTKSDPLYYHLGYMPANAVMNEETSARSSGTDG